MHDLVRHVLKLEKTTILFVTHDVEEAIYLGSRVVLMAPRPGRIDSIYKVPMPAPRAQDMKLSPEFTALKRDPDAHQGDVRHADRSRPAPETDSDRGLASTVG